MRPSHQPSTRLARRLLSDSELDREHLALLLEANALLSSSLSIERILDRLMDQVIEVLRAERGCVLMLEQGEWRFKTARAVDQTPVDETSFGISQSVIERVLQDGRALLTSDAQQDDRLRQQVSVGLHSLRSILCAPLSLQGEVRGVVYTDHRMEMGVFTGRQKELLVAIADQAGRALENAFLYEQLQQIHRISTEKARQELAETQAQLVESSKLAAVGQLAAGVAHEVNNPLGAIALNIGSLKKKASDPTSLRRLELMEGAVMRCQETIERLLRFSTPPRLQRRPVRLDHLLSETCQLLAPSLERAEILLNTQLAPVTIHADPDQLNQVFLNLMLNAQDALDG